MLAFKEQLLEPKRAISSPNVYNSAGILLPEGKTLLHLDYQHHLMYVFHPGDCELVRAFVCLFHCVAHLNLKWFLHS